MRNSLSEVYFSSTSRPPSVCLRIAPLLAILIESALCVSFSFPQRPRTSSRLFAREQALASRTSGCSCKASSLGCCERGRRRSERGYESNVESVG